MPQDPRLEELIAIARHDRVLYRLHRARYWRSMRQLAWAAGVETPDDRHGLRSLRIGNRCREGVHHDLQPHAVNGGEFLER